MTMEAAFLAAISALTAAVIALWHRVVQSMRDCENDRKRCEEALHRMFEVLSGKD